MLPNRDPFRALLHDLGVDPERVERETRARGDQRTCTQLFLQSAIGELPERRALELQVQTLQNAQAEALGDLAGRPPGQTPQPDLHYLPTPGRSAPLCQRIPHPCECEGGGPKAALTQAPQGRGREWAYHLAAEGPRPELTIVFCYDPHQVVGYHHLPEAKRLVQAYWREALLKSGIPHAKPALVYALTGLHQWHQALDGTPGPHYHRFPLPPEEKTAAQALGLDVHLSTATTLYAWSNLGKNQSKARAKLELQNRCAKQVFIAERIYGNDPGALDPEPPRTLVRRRLENLDAQGRAAYAAWQALMTYCVDHGVSDIHLDPQRGRGDKRNDAVISIRLHNQLLTYARVTHERARPLLMQATAGSGVNLEAGAETPKDARSRWTHPRTGHEVDLRISVTPLPTPDPKVVLRILDPARTKKHVRQLGLSPQENDAWDRILGRQEGIVLVCGKTGSGKSVTLNAALHTLHHRDPTVDITTIEDPIEYQLDFRCTQHQVDVERGLTYVSLLTQFLRNDIDRVMVGEIRNAATCEAAYELAITGPQILTTLHAANGYDAILRVQDFKLEPRKVSRLTRAVITQALVPTPCPSCARGTADGKLTPQEAHQALRDHDAHRFVQEHLELYRSRNPDLPPDGRWVLSSREAGGGCDACRYTGYGGRHAAQEFLVVEKADQDLILNKDFETLEARQRARGFLSLQARIWEMAFQGIVPINAAADAA